ncbi:ribonuclease domain-containing protein [Nocardioides speluncae]|uniref:ribonuclease domain-containing protein n=1 Tax=Nocardioides speluncae TaxID=2670337 RepID=UPI001F0BC732|nr:ribonuclease domain-containing protein [Nocardioides speluncae]
MKNKRTFLGLLVALLTAVLVWWLNGDGGGTTQDDRPDSTPSAQAPQSTPTPSATPTNLPSPPDAGGETDPDSGLPWVELDTLPPEAGETVALIDQGGPFPYPEKDGTTFSNREGVLPDQSDGYYKEYTVPTPGSDDRGARRIVTGSGGEFYWTEDHYRTFERIRR